MAGRLSFEAWPGSGPCAAHQADGPGTRGADDDARRDGRETGDANGSKSALQSSSPTLPRHWHRRAALTRRRGPRGPRRRPGVCPGPLSGAYRWIAEVVAHVGLLAIRDVT